MRTALVREVGSLAYVGSVEVQKRGRLHRHLLLWSPVPIDVARGQELALAAGYGCSVQWQKPYSAHSAADYVAKYITKSSGQRAEVPWEVSTVDETTGEIVTEGKRATYRTWSRSNKWGATMKGLRAVMAAQAAAREATRGREMYLRELGELLAEDQAAALTGGGSSPPSDSG